MANTVGELANGVWEDLGSPTSPTLVSISGWLSSDRGLGALNNRLDTCICVDSQCAHEGEEYVQCGETKIRQCGDFLPALTSEEAAIYGLLYQIGYYERKVRDSLAGLIDSTSQTTDWNELREGDSVIKRVNKSEVAKTYRNMLADANLTLNRMIDSYKFNKLNPLQVVGMDA